MAERNAALSYMALGKQTNPTTVVTPTNFLPYYDQNMVTDENIIKDQPIFGNKFRTYQVLQGHRSHKGSITAFGEPNTLGYWLDMGFTKQSSQVIYTFTVTAANATIGSTFSNNSQTFTVIGTIAAGTTLLAAGTGAPTASGTLTKVTGTGDTTITYSAFVAGTTNQHIFGLSSTQDPNSYTMDISLVSQVIRFWGVQASQIDLAYAGDELQPKIAVSALGSFYAAEIASVSTNTVVFTTTHDPSPTTGLVAADLVAIKKVDGSLTTNFTISSITNGTTVVLSGSAAAFSAGDVLVLRAATPSFVLLPNFTWPLNQFCFGTSAATALVAPQTRLEPGSQVTLKHDFKTDTGEPRSGGYDPASLVRMVGDYDFKIKQYFDLPDQEKQWLAVAKNSCVNRQFSGNGAYEIRTTMSNLRLAKLPIQTKFDEVIYQDEEYASQYDNTDGQGMLITLINGVTTY